MTLLEFMGQHAILTVIMTWLLGSTLVGIARALGGKK
jgi:hypothetical protein